MRERLRRSVCPDDTQRRVEQETKSATEKGCKGRAIAKREAKKFEMESDAEKRN